MRKIFVFIALALVFCLIGASAQPYQVEKAFKVKIDNKKITIGTTLGNNDIVEIDNNGYLLIVDQKSKKRYYINYPCRSKLSNLIKKAKSPMKVTKSFLETVLTKRSNTDYASAGNVYRGDNEELLESMNSDRIATHQSPILDSIPESILIDSTLIEGDTVTLYFVLP